MQFNHNLPKTFEFNQNSAIGGVICADDSNINNNGGEGGLDMGLIGRLLKIQEYNDKEVIVDLSGENAFLESWETTVKQQRAQHDEYVQSRVERKKKAEQNILQKIEEDNKNEGKKMDNEYATMVGEIETKKLEEARKKQHEQQNRDNMAYQLMAEFPNVEFQMGYFMLEEKNWNYQEVAKTLNEQKNNMRQQEEMQSQAIMKVFEQCPNVTDFDEVKHKLIQSNWNTDQVITQYKGQTQINFELVNCSNHNDIYSNLTLDKTNEGDTGMSIIQHLVSVKPLTGDTAYNVYRDGYKRDCINYLQLSCPVSALDIERQPLSHKLKNGSMAEYRRLYFNSDPQMKWD